MNLTPLRSVIQRLAHMIKMHSNHSVLIIDLQKTGAYNHFSEESKKVIHNLEHVEYKRLTEEKFDTLSIPYFVVKKRSRHGADCGKADALRENHQARHCFRNALKLKFCLLLEGFQQQDTYRESQHAVEIAKEDKSYIATWSERQRFENNWKLAFESARLNCTNDRERRFLRSC